MIATLLLAAMLVSAPRLATAPAASATPFAAPSTPAAIDEAIESLMGTIHGQPSPERWRALGSGSVAPLARIATDPAALPSRRARAVVGLSHLGGRLATATVRALASEDTAPFGVRAAALEGAGRLLGAAELRARLAPDLLGAHRPADRAVAAEVLAVRAPAECPAVRARAAREAVADRPGFDRALARCAASGR